MRLRMEAQGKKLKGKRKMLETSNPAKCGISETRSCEIHNQVSLKVKLIDGTHLRIIANGNIQIADQTIGNIIHPTMYV